MGGDEAGASGADRLRRDAISKLEVPVDGGPEAFRRDAPHFLEEALGVPAQPLVVEPCRPTELVERLAAEPVRVEPVTGVARRGTRVDDVEDVAHVRVVGDGIDPRVRGVLPAATLDPVVARVVGQDRDSPSREVRGDHELVILEPSPALREPDAVLHEHGPAEQLVRRQQSDERIARERLVIDRPTEGQQRHSEPMPDLLAEHHVGIVAVGAVGKPLEGLRCQPVVVIDEVDVSASRALDADVSRTSRPPGVRDVDRLEVAVGRGKLVEPGPGPVGRAVVDEDDLELCRGQALAEQGGNEPGKYSPGL